MRFGVLNNLRKFDESLPYAIEIENRKYTKIHFDCLESVKCKDTHELLYFRYGVTEESFKGTEFPPEETARCSKLPSFTIAQTFWSRA